MTTSTLISVSEFFYKKKGGREEKGTEVNRIQTAVCFSIDVPVQDRSSVPHTAVQQPITDDECFKV